jgi:transcriptional regulator GlxA family with amidase domain
MAPARQVFHTLRETRSIVLVAGEGTQILDVAGPAEVFSRCGRLLRAARLGTPPAYRVRLVSLNAGASAVDTTTGIALTCGGPYSSIRETPDTLLIAGGAQIETGELDSHFLAWLARHGKRARRLGAICTGAFALASAGLLAGRRCTTHWEFAEQLAAMFPDVIVDPDPIWIRDGNVVTSAGVTAGMDLALALVEEDHGAQVALQIARELVLYLRRPGTQTQFSAPLAAQLADRLPLRELQLWLPDNLASDLSTQALARRVSMSVRNFSRAFRREIGFTPGQYVDRLRVEAACLRLADSSQKMRWIAAQCGFQSAEVMRRTMLRVIRITPEDYRARFGARSFMRSPSPT